MSRTLLQFLSVSIAAMSLSTAIALYIYGLTDLAIKTIAGALCATIAAIAFHE